MIVRDISLPTLAANVLFDDVLLHQAETENGGGYLRFWESPQYGIVLGRIGKVEEDVKSEAVKANNIPVVRRSSGGGTVLQGKGCLNFSLVIAKKHDPMINDLKASYSYILGRVAKAMANLDWEVEFLPISDMVIKNTQRKFSGNAQKRGRHYILHHGTILYDFDLSLIEKYLTMPKDMPIYREGRKHLDFVTNIPIDPVKVKEQLRIVFEAHNLSSSITSTEQNLLDDFLLNKNISIPII